MDSDIFLRQTAGLLAIDSWKVNIADLNYTPAPEQENAQSMADVTTSGEALLFLTDEQLRKGIEAMFFAYRGFTADPDRILADLEYGRAHHRALHFINRSQGTTVNNLLAVLGVTKQSLNRVLRALIADGLVESRVGRKDRRERHLFLTPRGADLERQLSEAQRARMRAAYRAAGPQAVAGFRQVLEAMMDESMRTQYHALKDGKS